MGYVGLRRPGHHDLCQLARARGVRRVVVLSGGSAGHGDEHHLAVERAVEQVGIEWTHLRPYGLMSNALMWAESVGAASVVRAPYGRFSYPHVPEADVAAVAVAALLEDRHVGATYTISGPRAITQLEQVDPLSAASAAASASRS